VGLRVLLRADAGLEPVASPTCSQTGSSLIENINYNNQDVSSKPGRSNPGLVAALPLSLSAKPKRK
jgi:hypothetical protein